MIAPKKMIVPKKMMYTNTWKFGPEDFVAYLKEHVGEEIMTPELCKDFIKGKATGSLFVEAMMYEVLILSRMLKKTVLALAGERM